MNELKPEDVMRAIVELRKHGLNNGGALGYHAGWCDEVADLLENALALLREKDVIIKEFEHQGKIALKRIEEKDAEIERLSSRVSMLHEIELSYALQYGDAIDKDIARRQLRAEAITEFAERLKTFYRRLPGKTVGGSVEYHINQVLKEMMEKQ